ncbi:hypothetical protein [Paenibacillus wenxiniae]|uniref:Calcineurin-like phosphoesterase domain-containing protein n=1 Tax=Paenibacillus wenxiniae TaxID=1636843 RepID=A0ABW4RNL1_9BACL
MATEGMKIAVIADIHGNIAALDDMIGHMHFVPDEHYEISPSMPENIHITLQHRVCTTAI